MEGPHPENSRRAKGVSLGVTLPPTETFFVKDSKPERTAIGDLSISIGPARRSYKYRQIGLEKVGSVGLGCPQTGSPPDGQEGAPRVEKDSVQAAPRLTTLNDTDQNSDTKQVWMDKHTSGSTRTATGPTIPGVPTVSPGTVLSHGPPVRSIRLCASHRLIVRNPSLSVRPPRSPLGLLHREWTSGLLRRPS